MINYVKTNSMVIATDLTSICCFYKEKIVKNDSYVPKNVA